MSDYDDLLTEEEKQIKKNLGFTDEEKGVTYVLKIDDHSGSMSDSLKDDDGKYLEKRKSELALTNHNEHLTTLKKESDENMETFLTVIEFDNEIKVKYDNIPIQDVELSKGYWTGGSTALYDAIGYGIGLIEKRLQDDKRKNKAVLVLVETDGEENASKEYGGEEGRQKLRDKIKELEDSGRWTFTFLGAGLDEKFIGNIGFASGNIMATARSHNLNDTVHAYNISTDSLKGFYNDRKSGILSKSDFYEQAKNVNISGGDNTSDNINWNSSGGSGDKE